MSNTPIALTSLPAEGLYRLPHHPRTNTGKPKQQNQPVDSFEDDFSELDNSERLDDLADLINLRLWWGEHGPVSDAKLLEHWNTVAEQPLVLEQVVGLRAVCQMDVAHFERWTEEIEREAMT